MACLGAVPRATAKRAAAERGWALAAVARGPVDGSVALASATGDDADGVHLALDGRVDNRDELRRSLAVEPSAHASDAALLLAAYLEHGDGAFDRVVGPFAAVVLDSRRGCLRLVRDPLGARELYYRRRGAEIALASRPWPLATIDVSLPELDEESVVRYLAICGPRPGATFFAHVAEVAPGELIELGPCGEGSRRVAHLVPAEPPGAGTESDYEQRFREILDLAVACRVPTDRRCAVLMSGGLDSTAIAATAARHAAAGAVAQPLAVSWLFDELGECDERRWIEAMLREVPLASLSFAADDCWPLAGEPSWPRDLDSPFLGVYWRLHERAYELVRRAGCTVLLSGHGADDLWSGGEDWLRELVRTGRLAAALGGTVRALRLARAGHAVTYGRLAPVLRIFGLRSWRERLPTRAWLTPEARTRLAADIDGEAELSVPGTSRRARLLLPHHLAMLAVSRRESAPHGIEIRRPFADRRMVELFLALPARLLYRPGETKRLLRRALRDRLPSAILERRHNTSLLALGRRGLLDRGAPILRRTLAGAGAEWPRYVRREWLDDAARTAIASPRPSLDALVLWHCFALERWRQSLRAAAHSAPVSDNMLPS